MNVARIARRTTILVLVPTRWVVVVRLGGANLDIFSEAGHVKQVVGMKRLFDNYYFSCTARLEYECTHETWIATRI